MALTNGTATDSAIPSAAASTKQLFYRYNTIDKAKRAFRLLILRGGTGHDIDCEIVESTINSNTLPYEAVSYTWGPNFTADTVNINGKKLPVTFNLSLILRDLRLADVDRVVWVDAICINQQDATEKGHQVGQMQDIYALAERVLFCIARPTNYTDILMDSLKRLQSEVQNIDQSDDSAIDICWSKIQTAIACHHLNSLPQPSAATLLPVQLEAMTFLQRQGLDWIIGQPWFHRVWILQEVANARDALVCCGQKSVSAAVFALGARLLGYTLPDERRKTVDEVLNLMPGPLREKPSQDLLSLLRRFGKANASVERDRIYALFGICEDKQIHTLVTPNYNKSDEEVIIDTIAYICHCEVSIIATSPYDSIAHFLSDLDLNFFDNTSLLHFLRLENHRGALSILQRHGQSISLTPNMLDMAVSDTMMKEGVMSQLLEQRNASFIIPIQEGWKPLLFAAKHGYDTVVSQMLEKGAFIEACNPEEYDEERNMTSLFLAAMNGHETVVKILLENGAKMSRHDRRQGTPLAWAARNGHSSVVQLLVENGSDIEDDALKGRTPLSWAASKGHAAIVRLLLEHGADPTRKEPGEDDTPLSRAVEKGRKVIVKIILESRTNFDESCIKFALICAAKAARNSLGGLLLNVAASTDVLDVLDAMTQSHWEADDRREDFDAVVMMLCAKGAHFHISSNYLITAAIAGNERMLKLFLNCSAKVNYIGTRFINLLEGDYSGTALAFAIRYGHKDLAEVLLTEGAHLEARDSRKQTPLIMAAICGHENIVKMLLDKGADIGARDCYGQPPFVGACDYSHWNVVKLLLERGPDAAVRECNGNPLLRAAEDGREDIGKMLLARGADIEPRDYDQNTPLSRAASKGHVDIVKLLLENGADTEVKCSPVGQTPLHLAAENGHENTVRVLLENDANIKVRDKNFQMPLHLAAETGHEDIVRLLLKNGADIDARDKDRRTALSCAANRGHRNVVKVLLENGADIEAKDRRKRTPLTVAANRNKEDVVTFLLESGANPNVDMTRCEDMSYPFDCGKGVLF
ncbi:hypothetical protein G7054_g13078 [Neopestalotiopsis clavispora]|nr:hypothetical protein G7054_g13078 [Neopestalotiopsis clavispora]